MKTSLLHKEGIDLLVEETVIANELESGFDASKADALEHLPVECECKKHEIVELRNDAIIRSLENVNSAVTDIMLNLGKYAFAKEICLKDAMSELFKINLVLNTKYSLEDLFKGAEFKKEKDCNLTHICFDSMNLDLVQKYRDTITKYVSICHDCLFEDLFDRATLVKYLPIVHFLLSMRIY